MATRLTIGRAAEAAGCKVQTIRYYEQIGLLRRPPRSEGNQRLFAHEDIRRLAFIRHARALGFPLQAIRDLLSLGDEPDQPCEAVDAIARAQLGDVEQRIADCRVIEVLSDRTPCEMFDHAVPRSGVGSP